MAYRGCLSFLPKQHPTTGTKQKGSLIAQTASSSFNLKIIKWLFVLPRCKARQGFQSPADGCFRVSRLYIFTKPSVVLILL